MPKDFFLSFLSVGEGSKLCMNPVAVAVLTKHTVHYFDILKNQGENCWHKHTAVWAGCQAECMLKLHQSKV